MSSDQDDFVEFEDVPRDATWRMWSQDEFWLVLWLVESTASVRCLLSPEALDDWLRVESLVDVILAHQQIRNRRRESGPTMKVSADLIISREKVADRLDALQRRGLTVRFRPSGRISAIELAIHPTSSWAPSF